MAVENLSTYTEVDVGANRITMTATRVTFNTYDHDEEVYLYDDKEVGHFSGDFEHLLTAIFTGAANQSTTVFWGLANMLGGYYDVEIASADEILLQLGETGAGSPRIQIGEWNNGAWVRDYYIAADINLLWYITIKRDEAVGDNGHLYAYIYDAPAREAGDLVDTLDLTLTEKQDFRYIYAFQGMHRAGISGYDLNGYTENLDLQEAVGPANVKSVNGVAAASIKSINGVAIASVKSVNTIT